MLTDVGVSILVALSMGASMLGNKLLGTMIASYRVGSATNFVKSPSTPMTVQPFEKEVVFELGI